MTRRVITIFVLGLLSGACGYEMPGPTALAPGGRFLASVHYVDPGCGATCAFTTEVRIWDNEATFSSSETLISVYRGRDFHLTWASPNDLRIVYRPCPNQATFAVPVLALKEWRGIHFRLESKPYSKESSSCEGL
jgi:hypothetical protein